MEQLSIFEAERTKFAAAQYKQNPKTQQIHTGLAQSSCSVRQTAVTICFAADKKPLARFTHLATGTQPGALHGAPPTSPPMAHLPTPMPTTRQRLATDTVTVEVTLTAGQCLGLCAAVAADSG